MKLACFAFPIPFIIIFILISCSYADSTPSSNRFIYKPDGSKHCDSNPGVKLTVMREELSSQKIDVYSMRKGHDGREGIALCDKSTGQINIYEIESSDISTAIELGFKELHKN